jgi:hypothetical protein
MNISERKDELAKPEHDLILCQIDVHLLDFLKLEAQVSILAILHNDDHVVVFDELVLILYNVFAIKFS